jgi:hypothetical protein
LTVLEEKLTQKTALITEKQFSMVLAIDFDIYTPFSHSDSELFCWRLDVLFLTVLED